MYICFFASICGGNGVVGGVNGDGCCGRCGGGGGGARVALGLLVIEELAVLVVISVLIWIGVSVA